MAIVPLLKITLYGPAAEKDTVLDGLQSLGCMHLNDLRPNNPGAFDQEPAHPDARQALQYLKDSPVRRRAPLRQEKLDVEAVVKETIEVRDRSRALAEERVQLLKWIAELEPWGDFELPQWAREGALRFWFYAIPLHQLSQLQAVTVPWRVAARDHRFAYIVAIAGEQPANTPVPPMSFEPRSLAKLRARLEEVENDLEELDYRRIGLTRHTRALRGMLDEADDRAARRQAAAEALERDQLFAVQGWAPSRQAPLLEKFSAAHGLAITLEPPGELDKPPTLLSNPPTLRGGEGLIEFYTTPAYRLWDPSRAVFFCFALFFAMILSDAGYAALLGVLLAVLWRRMGATAAGRGLRVVFLALVALSIVYGVLVGAYFGVEPPAGSWLASLHVLSANDQRLMMWIAIAVGAVHLAYANLVTAWVRRRSASAFAALGWIAVILGGFLVAIHWSYPAFTSLARGGLWAMWVGGPAILLFSSREPLSLAPAALLHRLLEGLKGLTELSKAFGDVLSYLRLFALGLASIKLAEAFNSLAAMSWGGVATILGVLVLLVGHSINLAMGIMGGVVHGLRLNLIEFFNWSLPEEGERFRTFERKALKTAE
jgi:V/A-type H+/Na+-transporting ATPase subunit I